MGEWWLLHWSYVSSLVFELLLQMVLIFTQRVSLSSLIMQTPVCPNVLARVVVQSWSPALFFKDLFQEIYWLPVKWCIRYTLPHLFIKAIYKSLIFIKSLVTIMIHLLHHLCWSSSWMRLAFSFCVVYFHISDLEFFRQYFFLSAFKWHHKTCLLAAFNTVSQWVPISLFFLWFTG